MRPIRIAILGAAVLALAIPADLSAQGKAKGKHKDKDKNRQEHVEKRSDVEIDRDDERVVVRERGRVIVRDGDRDIVIRDRDVDRRYRVKRGQGPAFCRSGAGHPVHGRVWCLDKGFGLGNRGDVFFEDDDRVIFWGSDDEVVVVRDRRLDRDASWWERVIDNVLFWRD